MSKILNKSEHKAKYPLHHAAYRGDIEYVMQKIAKDSSLINAKDNTGMNLLHVSCWIGQSNQAYYEDGIEFSTEKSLKMVKFLLEKGINPIEEDSFSDTALLKVGYKGPIPGVDKTQIARALIDSRPTSNDKTELINYQGGYVGKYPLYEAIFYGDKELSSFYIAQEETKLHLKTSTNETPLSYLHQSISEDPDHKEMFMTILNKLTNGEIATNPEIMLEACRKGHTDIIAKFLDRVLKLDNFILERVGMTENWEDIEYKKYPLEKAELGAKLVNIINSGILNSVESLVFGGVNLFRDPSVKAKLVEFIKNTTTSLKKVVIRAEEDDILEKFKKTHSKEFKAAEKELVESVLANSNITDTSFPGFDNEILEECGVKALGDNSEITAE